MTKTLNIFQQEWHELQKKGTFHDVQIGLITDMHNKNAKLGSKIETMKVELKKPMLLLIKPNPLGKSLERKETSTDSIKIELTVKKLQSHKILKE